MPSFPLLKSGVVAQYPLDSIRWHRTQAVRFLDGSSQRYPLSREVRRWTVSLTQIDEQEMDALVDFVEEMEGGAFSFTDPVSGEVIANCVIADAGLSVTALSELNCSASLVIQEVV